MRIQKEDCLALFIDFQERLMPVIHEHSKTLKKAAILAEGLRALEVPMIVTRQYPKGLGDTVSEIREVTEGAPVLDKTKFSCWNEEEIQAAIKNSGAKSIILCGVEAHICVLQTLFDLNAAGYTTMLVLDATSSRDVNSVEIAKLRAMQESALMTNVESLLFELQGQAGGDTFKTISKLIK